MAQRVKTIVGRCGSAIREARKANLTPSRRTEGFMPTPIDRSSIRSLSHLNSRKGIKGFSSLAPSISSGGDVHAELGVNSVYKSSVRHDLAMLFTCKVCETRSAKTMCRETYEKGIVIIRCGGCKNLHLIADRLGWFGEKGSVEDFLAQQGVEVKRASEESYEFRLEDLVGRGASNEVVAEGE